MIKLTPKEIFQEYLDGSDYKNSIGDRGIYEQSKMNERFYVGDQWHGVQAGNSRPLVRRNVIKRIGEYKIATVCANPVTVNYSAEGVPDAKSVTFDKIPEGEVTNEEISYVMNILNNYHLTSAERVRLNEKLQDLVRDAFITGTGLLYTYWDENVETGLFADTMKTMPIKGDINCKPLSVVNVVFGDPNNSDIQSQPYIIISQRLPLSEVTRQAEKNSNLIKSDTSISNAGDRGEKEPEDSTRVTVLTKFYKSYENGTVTVKAIRVIEDGVIKDEWDMRIRLYPLASFTWLPRASSAYGDSEVTYLIPNQIAINRSLSAAVWSSMITGMPKTVVNRDLVTEQITNDPGQIININGGTEYDVQKAMAYVYPPQFAPQLQGVVQDIAESTMSDAGANDAALGDLRPDNAAAIIAVREATLVPMQVYQNRYYSFCEDVARIWAEFWLSMYGERPMKYRDKSGTKYMPFNSERYRELVVNAKVDVGASTLWGEAVVVTSLGNLLEKGIITPIQYLKRIPKGIIPDVTGLIEELQETSLLSDFKDVYPDEYEKFNTLSSEDKTEILKGAEYEG